MKRVLLFGKLLAIVIAITTSSCKQETEVTNPSEGLTVQQAQEWYESTQNQFIALKSAEEDKPVIMKPSWEGAFESSNTEFEVVESHVMSQTQVNYVLEDAKSDFEENNGYPTTIVRLVVMKHKATGNIEAILMSIVGDKEYLKKKNGELWTNTYMQNDWDFNGIVFYHTMKGEFISGWAFENGVANRTVTPTEPMDGEEVISIAPSSLKYQVCQTFTVGGSYTSLPSWCNSGTDCSYYTYGVNVTQYHVQHYTYCWDVPQPGNPAPTPPHQLPVIYTPSNDVKKFANNIYISNSGINNLNDAVKRHIQTKGSNNLIDSYMVPKGLKVNIRTGSTPSGTSYPVSYTATNVPEGKVLYFKDESSITEANLEQGLLIIRSVHGY